MIKNEGRYGTGRGEARQDTIGAAVILIYYRLMPHVITFNSVLTFILIHLLNLGFRNIVVN